MLVAGASIVMVGIRISEVYACESHGIADLFRKDMDLCP